MTTICKNRYVAIMAGGIGTRFWPESRIAKPKQFLDVLNNGKSLLQNTVERFEKFIPLENIFIVTFKDYINMVIEQLPKLKKENVLGEPIRKNTAPCLAYVAFKLQEINPNAELICTPADHLIDNDNNFIDTCEQGFEFIEKHTYAFVTIGIPPTHPNTGFGYIQFIKDNGFNIKKVKTFTEKPNIELAEQFVNSGEFLWNSGMFIIKNQTLLKAFETHMPEMFEVFDKHKTLFNSKLEANSLEKIYPLCANVSLDYGVLEKVSNVFVVPAIFGWNDLGTWNSLHEVNKKTKDNNVELGGDIMSVDSHNNIIQGSKNKIIVIKGLENFIVIDTPDALLICDRDKEQEVKGIIEQMKIQKLDKYL